MVRDLKITNKIKIGDLETEITGFNTIGNNKMVCTPYGEFNITLVKRPMKRIKNPPVRRTKHAFRGLKIGEAKTFHLEYSRTNMSLASNAARNWKNKSKDCKDWEFRTEKVSNKIRIWRVK